jgi:hypothetical protein
MINQTTEVTKNDLPSPSDFCDAQYDPRPRHLAFRRGSHRAMCRWQTYVTALA